MSAVAAVHDSIADHGTSLLDAMALAVNELAGSGGDAMPLFFRRRGLGKLVGKRTWGGLIGISGAPPLVDGGQVTVPLVREWLQTRT